MKAFVLMLGVDILLVVMAILLWPSLLAGICAFMALGCWFSTAYAIYLTKKTGEWPKIVGGPGIHWAGKHYPSYINK